MTDQEFALALDKYISEQIQLALQEPLDEEDNDKKKEFWLK